MKAEYIPPVVEITKFETEDIILSSKNQEDREIKT